MYSIKGDNRHRQYVECTHGERNLVALKFVFNKRIDSFCLKEMEFLILRIKFESKGPQKFCASFVGPLIKAKLHVITTKLFPHASAMTLNCENLNRCSLLSFDKKYANRNVIHIIVSVRVLHDRH